MKILLSAAESQLIAIKRKSFVRKLIEFEDERQNPGRSLTYKTETSKGSCEPFIIYSFYSLCPKPSG